MRHPEILLLICLIFIVPLMTFTELSDGVFQIWLFEPFLVIAFYGLQQDKQEHLKHFYIDGDNP